MQTLRYYVKRYWFFFPLYVISLFIFIVGIIRTNKALILKGDTVEFTSVVDVNTENEQHGSFSTIYVFSMEKATVLQNWIANGRVDIESYEISKSTTHLTDIENYQAGKIQYNSSIGNALVLAYSEASKKDSSIHLEYSFVGYDVTWYSANSSFRIGDRILGYYSSILGKEFRASDDSEEFKSILTSKDNKSTDDYFIVNRKGQEINISNLKENSFTAYGIYEYNQIKSNPTFSVSSNLIGGPSGGLLQALSIYNQLISEDLTHGLKIAGTGTIKATGEVGAIGGIKEKIPTAFDDHIDVFFVCKANYEDAKIAYDALPNNDMKLVEIETFYDALDYLMEGYKNDFGN